MSEDEKTQMKKTISFGLTQNQIPKGSEYTNPLLSLPAGPMVLLYRRTSKTLEGPHLLIRIDGETSIVQTRRNRSIFRSTCVKPFIHAKATDNDDATRHMSDSRQPSALAESPQSKERTKRQTKLSQKLQNAISFTSSRKQELRGLLENGTFLPIPRQDIPENAPVFGSRFIEKVKKDDH